TAKQRYGAGLTELDFERDTEQARQTINAWVAKETRDKIKDLIAKDVLHKDTRLVLTNAIYFKAAWLENFFEAAPKKGNFKVSDGETVPVMFMHKADAFSLVQTDTFEMLELPYESRDLSLLVSLPRKVDGLADVEKGITSARLDEWLSQRKTYQVKLALPK